jgi:coenzyme F420 biosynthesis associated uncharacterized protein
VADPISWSLAERVAGRVAGTEPLAGSYLYSTLQPDFEELTAHAEALVEAETGLKSSAGPARARVTDRPGWVRANIASFQRLLRPVTAKLESALDHPPTIGPVRLPVAAIGRNVTGTQVGLLLGWMSTRVLGQYDQLLIEDEQPEDQDIVYYVGPNILALEKRYAFPPREFRLWLALHEVTHRMQFTGIPWMRGYFIGLIESTLAAVDPDPRKFLDALKRSFEQVREGHNPLDDGGLLSLVAGPDQYEAIQRIGGLMSLLEGHGDVTMDRAGADRIPSADRFSRVLRERRRQRGPMKVVAALSGLDAKLRQYEQGERFIAAVEAEGGPALLGTAWAGPERLPTMEEIRSPERWIARVTSSATPAGASGAASSGPTAGAGGSDPGADRRAG